jgi:hypothetical protein
MTTKLKLLNQNNKKMSGGGNVKQGIVPAATKFYGMRLKTNLNAARNNGASGAPYDGVCFEQFDGSVKCIPFGRKDGLTMVAADAPFPHATGFACGASCYGGGGPAAAGSLNPSGAAGTEIQYVYTNTTDIQWYTTSGPRQVNLRFAGNIPTSFTITGVFGGNIVGWPSVSSSYTLRTDWVNGINNIGGDEYIYTWYAGNTTLPGDPGSLPASQSAAAIPGPGFLFIDGNTYNVFIN